jgi:adenine-specific DNA methylase
MTYRKKLIEVALPLDAINVESGHEKDVHTGLPANLHVWWARRPLAACRAVLFASLVDDPMCLSTQNSATVMMKNGATPRSWPSPFCAGFL